MPKPSSKGAMPLKTSLGDGYIIALNLLANTPEWMAKIKAKPMFLGLDLRGGVHFTMQVDMAAAKQKTLERYRWRHPPRIAQASKSASACQNHQSDKVITVPFQNAADAKSLPE
jgi:preprotein translocase subunit SecD